jgi:hypothetical protein
MEARPLLGRGNRTATIDFGVDQGRTMASTGRRGWLRRAFSNRPAQQSDIVFQCLESWTLTSFLLGTKLELIATILLPNSVAPRRMDQNSRGRSSRIL